MDNAGIETDAAKKHEVELQQVLGLTVCNNSAIDSDPQTGTVAYPAGCVIVLYNVRKNKQRHIINDAKRTITTLSFSWDGKYLATGECGSLSHLRIWDVQKYTQVADLSGHKHGINCVAFSPNMKYVVSVGSQHDMIVNVWDWKSKVKVASNKVSCKVKALSFSAGGNYFVTVGNNHVKFWYLEYSRSTKYKLEPVPLMGRSAILGDQRNNYFCDVACGRGDSADSTYAVTKSGLLCEFNGRRLLDKWVELRTSVANSISVGEHYIFIGCAEGVVRCFSPVDLHFICTLPRPHYLGVDIAKGLTGRHMNSHPPNAKYPDTIAVTLDESNKKVTCVYNDHSMYVWDIRDMKKVGKSHSFLYHSACIWGIEMYPQLPEGIGGVLPSGTFFTCASDDTIRIWNLEPNMAQNTALKRNIYCLELLKILYTDSDLTFLCNMDLIPAGINEKVDATYDGKNGVRCLRISPNGHHLASGDRSGNVRIYDLQYMEMLCKIEAHDSEVLCLDYSNSLSDDCNQLLSSASRDRLIHVFDVQRDYAFLQTLDDHTSSVTATKFVACRNDLHFVSCGADKAVIFRKVQMAPQKKIVQEHHVIGKTTLYDMEVDASQYHVLTACQDRNVRVYGVVNGKHIRTFPGAEEEEGTLIKIVMDPSGLFVATSSTDKTVYIYDYLNGQCVASMMGHSELVTGLKFSPSGKHLISVSGDGCIFVWKLPVQLTKAMMNAKQIMTDSSVSSLWQDNRKSVVAVAKPFQKNDQVEKSCSLGSEANTPPTYQFNIGQLPSWAKKQMSDELKHPANSNKSSPPPIHPRGRWAQRLDGQALVVKSYLHTDSVIPFPHAQGEQQTEHTTIKYTATESRNSINLREETISHSKQISISRTSVLQDGETSILHGSKRDRVRHPTDSSSASSLRLDDGDAEDERSDSGATETSEIVYYPHSEEMSETKDSSFHICATKEESKSARKNKPGISHSFSSASIPDKVDLVSDDDDSGTPAEGERSLVGSFSLSTENLERLDMRERYMLDNYESLDKEPGEDDSHQRRHSISTKYLSNSVQPPRPITPGRGTPQQILSKRREELTRALNDARKKLETLGWRSGLSSSKSVGDLRNVSEKDCIIGKQKPYIADDTNDMRRSTSFSDISATLPSPRRRLPTTPHFAAGSQHAPLWAQAKKHLNFNSELSDSDHSVQTNSTSSAIRTNLRHSASSSALAYSPEQSKANVQNSQGVSNLNLSTISDLPLQTVSPLSKSQSSVSMNTLGKTSTGTRRLSLAGLNRWQNYSDSSSSEASPTEMKNTVVPRGLVARRLRAFCPEPTRTSNSEGKNKRNKSDREPSKSKSEWDLRKLSSEPDTPHEKIKKNLKDIEFSKIHDDNTPLKLSKAQTLSGNIKDLEVSPKDLPVRDRGPSSSNSFDITSVPLTQELCDKVSEELKRVTAFAVHLFQRVTIDPQLTPVEKTSMTTTLAQGVWQAQQNLQPATTPLPKQRRDSQPDSVAAMALLQQYSDKLLSLVEQRITKTEK